VWFDVRRTNGFHGDISLIPGSLPPGVTLSPLTLPENGSGWLTLSASADAPQETVALKISSHAQLGMSQIIHDSQPDAYLTVLDSAPFSLQTTAALTPPQIQQLEATIRQLTAKLSEPNPRLQTEQAKWEKKIIAQPIWEALENINVSS